MISAPLSLMMSCGRMVLPSDLDIFLPSSSTTNPWVITALKGGRPRVAEADQQRALEPAAVLVAALEVEVGGPRQFLAERQHGLVARAGVEPDIEDVALALELGAAAGGAREPLRDELLDRPLVPGVGAVGVEDRRRLLHEAQVSAVLHRTSCSRRRGSALPRRAGARCTSRAGSRPCCRCGRGPTWGSSGPRLSIASSAALRSVRASPP